MAENENKSAALKACLDHPSEPLKPYPHGTHCRAGAEEFIAHDNGVIWSRREFENQCAKTHPNRSSATFMDCVQVSLEQALSAISQVPSNSYSRTTERRR